MRCGGLSEPGVLQATSNQEMLGGGPKSMVGLGGRRGGKKTSLKD